MTKHIISDELISALDEDRIDEVIQRLYEARAKLRAARIGPLLVKLLESEGITNATSVEMGTWDWDDGWFPYLGDTEVVLSTGERVEFSYLSSNAAELEDLISAEARSFGLGQRSRIIIDVPSGDIDVQ